MTRAKTKPAPKRKPRAVAIAAPAPFVLRPGHALMLRTSRPNGASQHTPSFVWPESGPVSAPDWNPAPVCGGGLHGYLWGDGDAESILWATEGARWQIVDVLIAEVVMVGGKVKVPRGEVVHTGTQKSATEFLAPFVPAGTKIIGGTSTSGVRGTSTSGYGGTSTSGDGGTSTSGVRGTSTSGDGGTSTSGDGGTIAIHYFDPKRDKYRVAIAEVGENGIAPNTAYVLDEAHRFVRKDGAK